MEDKDDSAEKTEAPTAQRLKKLKERGQMPRFASVLIVSGLLGGMAGLGLCWAMISGDLKTGFSECLRVTQRSGWRDIDMSTWLIENILFAFKLMLPFFMTVLITCFVGAYCVSGFSISWHRVHLQLNRCNPLKGWQRWMGHDVWINVVGACLKCLSVVLVFTSLIKMQCLSVLVFDQYKVTEGSNRVLLWCFMATLSLISPLIAWTVFEVMCQKWSFFKKMKMSKRDIKEEIKQEEGSHEIKSKIKQCRHQELRDKTKREIKTATVLITDGHWYSVVLRYVEREYAAPMMVAKGLGLRAKQLKKMAYQHGVTEVIDPLLARQLFAQAVRGRLIPAALYSSVAKVLAGATQLQSNHMGSQ